MRLGQGTIDVAHRLSGGTRGPGAQNARKQPLSLTDLGFWTGDLDFAVACTLTSATLGESDHTSWVAMFIACSC